MWWYGADGPHLAIPGPLVGKGGEQARLVKTVKGSADLAGSRDVGFRPSAFPRGNLGVPEAIMCTPMMGGLAPGKASSKVAIDWVTSRSPKVGRPAIGRSAMVAQCTVRPM